MNNGYCAYCAKPLTFSIAFLSPLKHLPASCTIFSGLLPSPTSVYTYTKRDCGDHYFQSLLRAIQWKG